MVFTSQMRHGNPGGLTDLPEATRLENDRAGFICVTGELAFLLTGLCVSRLPPLGQLSSSCLAAVSVPPGQP